MLMIKLILIISSLILQVYSVLRINVKSAIVTLFRSQNPPRGSVGSF